MALQRLRRSPEKDNNYATSSNDGASYASPRKFLPYKPGLVKAVGGAPLEDYNAWKFWFLKSGLNAAAKLMDSVAARVTSAEATNRVRGREIENRCIQIHNLHNEVAELRERGNLYKKDVKEKNRQIAKLQSQHKAENMASSSIKKLSEANDQRLTQVTAQRDSNSQKVASLLEAQKKLEEAIAERDDMIHASIVFLEKETGKVKTLVAQNERLHAEIETLRVAFLNAEEESKKRNQQSVSLAIASGNDFTRLSLEAQAERTLVMVRGLQSDIAERDARIEQLVGHLEEARYEASTAQQTASDIRSIAEDQDSLIQRLLQNSGASANK